MSKEKYFYYVQVTQAYRDGNGEVKKLVKRYVTEINAITQTAKWEKNKKPLAMSKAIAQSICKGLLFNFYEAVIVTSYYELNEVANWEK